MNHPVCPASGSNAVPDAPSGVVEPLLYLASGSPRRAELLHQAGIPFHALGAPGIDESVHRGEIASDYVCRVATEKALCGFSMLSAPVRDNALVLAADTIVVLDGQILGKPASDQEAKNTLRSLSGRHHEVLTAIALQSSQHKDLQLVKTHVGFRTLDDCEISAYVTSGEPRDKAGAYGIQGRAASMITTIRGSYSGVVGLPLAETIIMLAKAGFNPFNKQDLFISE